MFSLKYKQSRFKVFCIPNEYQAHNHSVLWGQEAILAGYGCWTRLLTPGHSLHSDYKTWVEREGSNRCLGYKEVCRLSTNFQEWNISSPVKEMWKVGLITIVGSVWLVGEWLTVFYMLAGMACVSILNHISTVTLYINIINQNITFCKFYIHFYSKSKILKDIPIMHFPLVFLNDLYRQNSHLFICTTRLYVYVLFFNLPHKVMDFIVVFWNIYFIFIHYGP